MPNKLHTIFCHRCGEFMNYPYEHKDELYHKDCLPYVARTFISIDEACRYADREAYESQFNKS